MFLRKALREEITSKGSVEYSNIDHQQISAQLNALLMKNQQTFQKSAFGRQVLNSQSTFGRQVIHYILKNSIFAVVKETVSLRKGCCE